jgi:hypothetical protein
VAGLAPASCSSHGTAGAAAAAAAAAAVGVSAAEQPVTPKGQEGAEADGLASHIGVGTLQ